MTIKNLSVSLSDGLIASACVLGVWVTVAGCDLSGTTSPSGTDTSAGTPSSVVGSGTSSASDTTTGASGSSGLTTSTVNAVQIITSAASTGSFDPASVPVAGGVTVKASRLYGLDGTLIPTASLPPWFVDANVFLTSTRTAGGANPTVPSGSNTPCAYFDSYGDNNNETDGYYVIDGYNADNNADIDQCAGVSAAEANQLSIYIDFDRRFMNPTDKFQLIIKAKPIEDPNYKVTPSSCTTAGFFNPGACSNQVYGISMRASPGASAKPFYLLWPSAKAYDLLSESVIMPINIDPSISTISIDRSKGGAIFYGISIIRLQ